jgi:hypothetical protein
LAETMPVQTPGSGSDGVTVSPSSANRLQLQGRSIDPLAQDLLSGRANRKAGVINAVAGEQAPGDPRILVGERDGDNVGVSPLLHLAKPQASWILFFSNPPERGASAVDQQRAQIAISTFADAG